jgi:hypothetical protein
MGVEILAFVSSYWWVWLLLAVLSFWLVVAVMNRTDPTTLIRRGYSTWPVFPFMIFGVMFVVSLIILGFRAYGA